MYVIQLFAVNAVRIVYITVRIRHGQYLTTQFQYFLAVSYTHLLANYLCEYGDLDEVWFMVTPHNPLKEENELMDDKLRLKLVQLATEGLSLIHIFEVKVGTGGQLAGVSYQCDGFTPFHRIAFPFQQRAAMLVD